MARHPNVTPLQLNGLIERVTELERGETTLEVLRRDLLSMCAMCQELMLDLDQPGAQPELIDRLEYRIDLLRRLVDEAQTGTDGQ
jgi:hypothetical protein